MSGSAHARIYRLQVARVMILRGDQVLLTQRALKGKQGGLWELPGGALLKGETPEQAALRETMEEIGARIEITRKMAEDSYRVRKSFMLHTTLFAAKLVDDSPFEIDPTEIADVQWFDFDALPGQINKTTQRVIFAAAA
jgi:8-oxo-dGTP diphosphatase